MSPNLRSELAKLWLTRSLLALPLAGLAVAAIGTVVVASTGKAADLPARLSEYGPLRFGPTNFGLLVLVFGVRLFTDEHQHGTVVPTFIRTPDRRRVLGAKLTVAVTVTAVFCVIAYVLVGVLTAITLSARDLSMAFDAGATATLFGRVVLGMTSMAALGVAVGAAVRNRTVALVAVIIWFALVEDVVGGLLRVSRFLPSTAMQSLVSADASAATTALAGGVLLTAVAAGALTVAAVTLRRDVA